MVQYRKMMVLVIIGVFYGASVVSAYNTNWINVISPNGGEIWSGVQTIRWNYGTLLGVYCTFFEIYCIGLYAHIDIEEKTYITSTNLDEGSCSWDTRSVPDGQYKIRVELWAYSDWQCQDEPTLRAQDTSDGWFIVDNNDGPNTPNTPSGPIIGTIGESLTFSTSTTDPDGDHIKYGWDWDGDNNVDEWSNYLSSGSTDTRSHSWNDEGFYAVKVRAKDINNGQSSWSEALTVTISEETADADLDCSGSLSWSSVEPGGLATGSFTVGNVGDPGSLLEWCVESFPSWGEWTFTPKSGLGLTPGDGSVTVEVFVVAPDIEESSFSGEIMVMNEDDSSDYETISVSLATPKNRVITNPLFQFFEKILQNNQNLFPLLRNILDM